MCALVLPTAHASFMVLLKMSVQKNSKQTKIRKARRGTEFLEFFSYSVRSILFAHIYARFCFVPNGIISEIQNA